MQKQKELKNILYRMGFALCSSLPLYSNFAPALIADTTTHNPELQILSSGSMSYLWETDTIVASDGVSAHYGDYTMHANDLEWNRQEGRIEISGDVAFKHKSTAPLEEREREVPSYQAWLPTSFQNRSFLMLTEEIIFFSDEGVLDSIGVSSVLFHEGRLNTHSIHLRLRDDYLIARNIQGGNGTFFFSAREVEATDGIALLTDITLFAGEPDFWNPRIRASQARITEQGHANLRGVSLGIGPVPLLYLPRAWARNWDFGVNFTFGGGFSDKLGTYADLGISFRLLPYLSLSPDVSYYSRRGVLLSPNFAWEKTIESTDWITEGRFQSGYINDRGTESLRGDDAFGEPIGHDRGYVNFQGMVVQPGSWSFVNQYQYGSDTDVLRDFRPDLEEKYFAPESFSEWYVPFGPFGFTALGRFRTMDVREALAAEPSVRLDMYPLPLGDTETIQRGWLAYNRLRLSGGNVEDPVFTEQFEAAYRLNRPYSLNEWLTLNPTAGARWRSYQNSDPGPSTSHRVLYETGFDLQADFHGHWQVESDTWRISELIHRLQPLIGYRWMPVTGDPYDDLPQIEPFTYLSGTDPLGFAGLENETSAGPRQILRIGAQNQLLARGDSSDRRFRQLASWGIYQDFIEKRSEDPARPNNLSTNLQVNPAPWVDAQLFARVYSDTFTLQEITPSFGLRDGDQWETRIFIQSLQRTVNQVLWMGDIAINPRNRVFYRIRYDGQKQEITEQRYGLRRQLGNAWILSAATTFRRGDQRQGDFQFQISLTSLIF